MYLFAFAFAALGFLELILLPLVLIAVIVATVSFVMNGVGPRDALQLYWLFFIGLLALPLFGGIAYAFVTSMEEDSFSYHLFRVVFLAWVACLVVTISLLIALIATSKRDRVFVYPITPVAANESGRLLCYLFDLYTILPQRATNLYPMPSETQLSDEQTESFADYVLDYPNGVENMELNAWTQQIDRLYSLFDTLPPVDAATLYCTRWRGQTLPVGPLGWVMQHLFRYCCTKQFWGKSFESCLNGIPLMLWFGYNALPIPIWGNVTLADLTHRNVLTAAITYQSYPWQEHVRLLGRRADGRRVLLVSIEFHDKCEGFCTLVEVPIQEQHERLFRSE